MTVAEGLAPLGEPSTAGESPRPPRRRIVDVAFATVVVVTIACWSVWGRHLTFTTDDWAMLGRGHSLADLFRPFNDHLSLVPISIWRLSYHFFGLRSYLPLRVVGMVSLAAVGIGVFSEVRARIGAPVALVVGTVLLWYPNLTLGPQAFNHYLAVAAGVLCASVLRRAPSSDVLLGAALAFALCSSGAGVSCAAGCIAYLVFARAPLRRWAAVLIPSATWLLWWVLMSHQSRPALARSFSQGISFVLDGVVRSFAGLAFGNRVAGMVIGLAFLASLGWRCRRGPRRAAAGLAWTFALISWWVGLAYSRGLLTHSGDFRYDLIGTVFVVLAAVPERVGPSRMRIANGREAVAAALAAALLTMAVNQSPIRNQVRLDSATSEVARTSMAVALLGPAVVPDGAVVQLGFTGLPAGELRRLVRSYGAPPGTRPHDLDPVLLRDHAVIARDLPMPTGHCVDLPAKVLVPPDAVVVLHSAGVAVVVEVRRFGPTFRPVATIPHGGTVLLVFRSLAAVTPWEMHAPGACRFSG